MPSGFYYVYALKDPRPGSASPFYIGKGTGSRAFDHLVRPDGTPKYVRIREIQESGHQPEVDILVDGLSEADALRIEAKLISALGTKQTGGLLTNSVVPSHLVSERPFPVAVSQGAVEQAQLGLEMLKDALIKLIDANADGVSNSEAASVLGLRSDYKGRQKDYLSYSVLGLLLREGRVVRREGRSPKHVSTRHYLG